MLNHFQYWIKLMIKKDWFAHCGNWRQDMGEFVIGTKLTQSQFSFNLKIDCCWIRSDIKLSSLTRNLQRVSVRSRICRFELIMFEKTIFLLGFRRDCRVRMTELEFLSSGSDAKLPVETVQKTQLIRQPNLVNEFRLNFRNSEQIPHVEKRKMRNSHASYNEIWTVYIVRFHQRNN